MASESEMQEPSSLIERLISSRNRDLSLLLPVVLGFTSTDEDSPRPTRDRIILINPLTQGMMIIEGSSASLDSLLRDLISKGGQPPASKASIESLASVVIGESEDGECAICLDEWLCDEVVKEMPCKHRFHGNCVEKWLKVHGTCPVCRYKMPVDDSDDDLRKNFGFGGGEGDEESRSSTSTGTGRREIWVSFSSNSDRRRRSVDSNSNSDSDSDESSTAMESTESTTFTQVPGADNQME